MMSQLEFVQSFVNDLLDLRMLQQGKFDNIREAFDMVSIVNLIISIFQPQVKAKDLKIQAEV